MSMAAVKLLANTLKKLIQEPVEGFTVELIDESNLFEWRVFIEGPKDTLYEGGVFELLMKFPSDFPMSPPELKFISDFWHPNVYKETGVVCISILHPPGEDELSGESASERWLPTQTVSTIILSVVSLLSAPNFSSPANVDAGVEWRTNPEGYGKKISRLVDKANKEKPSTVVIPHPETNPEEREKQIAKMKEQTKPAEDDDFMQHEDPVEENEESESPEEEESEGSDKQSGSSDDKKGKSSKRSNSKDKSEKLKSKGSKSSVSKKSSSQNLSKQKGKEEGSDGTIERRKKKKNCIVM